MFVDSFVKLRNATISFVMSVCLVSVRPSVCPSVRPSVCPSVRPCVRMEQLGSHSTYFNEILVIFENVEKIQVSLKSENNKGYFPGRLIYIFIIRISVLIRLRNMSHKHYRENQTTHSMFSIFFPKTVHSMR
jgi:hypothetical protein